MRFKRPLQLITSIILIGIFYRYVLIAKQDECLFNCVNGDSHALSYFNAITVQVKYQEATLNNALGSEEKLSDIFRTKIVTKMKERFPNDNVSVTVYKNLRSQNKNPLSLDVKLDIQPFLSKEETGVILVIYRNGFYRHLIILDDKKHKGSSQNIKEEIKSSVLGEATLRLSKSKVFSTEVTSSLESFDGVLDYFTGWLIKEMQPNSALAIEAEKNFHYTSP